MIRNTNSGIRVISDPMQTTECEGITSEMIHCADGGSSRDAERRAQIQNQALINYVSVSNYCRGVLVISEMDEWIWGDLWELPHSERERDIRREDSEMRSERRAICQEPHRHTHCHRDGRTEDRMR